MPDINAKPQVQQEGTTMKYYMPSIGGQIAQGTVNNDGKGDPLQRSAVLHSYSPRLLGAPPQLTNYNDMRLLSSDGNTPGPVGDFYLNDILRDSQVANFVVGRAVFTGGVPTLAEYFRTAANYARAIMNYDIYGVDGSVVTGSTAQDILNDITEEKIKEVSESNATLTGKTMQTDTGETYYGIDLSETPEGAKVEEDLRGLFGSAASAVMTPLLTSMKVQQLYYSFESDWFTYINNVKMMINTAVIMLGLQKACVRIGDQYLPIGMNASVTKDSDVWSNYRAITATTNLGQVTGANTLTGDTSQYVSFMIEPGGISESYQNSTGPSQIYSKVINQGNPIGREIAFLTSTSKNRLDDKVIEMAGDAVEKAEEIISNLSLGAGKFTAALLGSLSKSYIGDHTIYPDIFQQHTSNQSSISMKIKLVARGGDPYSFLTDIWVPMSFALCMVLPQMAKYNASAYSYPPLVQCNIPGVFGTQLGIVESINITKNSDGRSMSINGFPTSVDMTINVKDLQHTLVTSGMNDPSRFVNNNSMFDYIAQSCGCDKYKINGAVRLVSKLALTASSVNNTFYNVGSTLLNDAISIYNRSFGPSR